MVERDLGRIVGHEMDVDGGAGNEFRPRRIADGVLRLRAERRTVGWK